MFNNKFSTVPYAEQSFSILTQNGNNNNNSEETKADPLETILRYTTVNLGETETISTLGASLNTYMPQNTNDETITTENENSKKRKHFLIENNDYMTSYIKEKDGTM